MAKYYTRVYMNTGYTSPEAFQDVCFNNKNLNRLRQPHKLNQYLKFDEETGNVWWAMGYLEGYQYISNSEMISKLSNFKPNNAPEPKIFKCYVKADYKRNILNEIITQIKQAGANILIIAPPNDCGCFHIDKSLSGNTTGVGWATKDSYYDNSSTVKELSFNEVVKMLLELRPEAPTSIKFWEKDSFGRKLVGVVTKAGASFQFPVVDNCHAFDLTNDMIDALIEARNKLK